MGKQKITRGNASQFFVAGELCRRDLSAVVTLGNTPNTDILCSNLEGTRFVHIQVKTFQPGNRTCSVGKKAEKASGKDFFWVLSGIPSEASHQPNEYYIIPASVMSVKVKESHEAWLNRKGKQGQDHNPTDMQTIIMPPYKSPNEWDISEYLNRWDLIEDALKE